MEEEKRNKNNSGILIFFLIILVVFAGIYNYTEKVNHEKEIETLKEDISELQNNVEIPKETPTNAVADDTKTDTSEKNILDLGKYDILGNVVDPSDGDGIQSITLTKNNQFTIDLVYGARYVGEYTIEGNTLICSATKEEIYEGGDSLVKNTEATFNFKIIDNTKIEFLDVENIPSNKGYELNKGISYAILENNTEDNLKSSFLDYVKKVNDQNTEKLLDYRVDNIEIFSDSLLKQLINTYPNDYFENDILARVTYSVKPEDVDTSNWTAGNGRIEDGWIIEKQYNVALRNNKLIIIGTSW